MKETEEIATKEQYTGAKKATERTREGRRQLTTFSRKEEERGRKRGTWAKYPDVRLFEKTRRGQPASPCPRPLSLENKGSEAYPESSSVREQIPW